MPDNDHEDLSQHEGPKHPEANGPEALPLSEGTKKAITDFAETKISGFAPNPEFDNDIYVSADLDDPHYGGAVIIWRTPTSTQKEPNWLGRISLHLRDGRQAMTSYEFTKSPDGVQVEKDIGDDWTEALSYGGTQEEIAQQLADLYEEHQQALEEERELGLTNLSEGEGQKLLRLLSSAENWEAE